MNPKLIFIKFFRIKIKRKSTRKTKSRVAYLNNKEKARELVLEKLAEFNKTYGFLGRAPVDVAVFQSTVTRHDFEKSDTISQNRVAIRDTKSRWGSCSKKGNLNFNYRIAFLPPRLADYIVVHELCHLQEFNHSQKFWDLVSLAVPDYKILRKELKECTICIR